MFATNCSSVVPRLIDAGPPYRTYPLGFVSAQFPTRELSAGWHRLIVSAGDNVTTYWLGSNASGPNVSRVGFQADMRMLLAVGNRGVARRPRPSRPKHLVVCVPRTLHSERSIKTRCLLKGCTGSKLG